jgi:hypothetical protein
VSAKVVADEAEASEESCHGFEVIDDQPDMVKERDIGCHKVKVVPAMRPSR